MSTTIRQLIDDKILESRLVEIVYSESSNLVKIDALKKLIESKENDAFEAGRQYAADNDGRYCK